MRHEMRSYTDTLPPLAIYNSLQLNESLRENRGVRDRVERGG